MKKYWFRKRMGLFTKDMGYGWVPITKGGWISIAVLILAIFGLVGHYNIWNNVEKPIEFVVSVFVLIGLFALFCHKKCDYSIK